MKTIANLTKLLKLEGENLTIVIEEPDILIKEGIAQLLTPKLISHNYVIVVAITKVCIQVKNEKIAEQIYKKLTSKEFIENIMKLKEKCIKELFSTS